LSGQDEQVIGILRTVGKVESLSADQDFYEAGVSSISALSILMELESTYDVSIPDDEFVAARTPRALQQMIERLKQAQQV
jgi:acyl carrier protein